jgi:hypothetical protein
MVSGLIPLWTRLLLISILFFGCSETTESTKFAPKPQAPTLDLSTPDRALKSYWAQKDWLQALARRELESIMKGITSLYRDNMPKVTTGEVSEYFRTASLQEDERFRREIISVRQETDSRAIALVKITNVTPIPSEAEPTKYDLEMREKGEQFQYLLERHGEGWKVADVAKLSNGSTWHPYRREKLVPKYVVSDSGTGCSYF